MEAQNCNDPLCEKVRKGERHPMHDTSALDKQRHKQLSSLVEVGSEITGATMGAIPGFILGRADVSVFGAAAGLVLARTLKNIGLDFMQRTFGPREKTRIGASWTFVVSKIETNLRNGHALRNDDFFIESPPNRSSFEEILEGTLMAAQKEFEEKKVELFSYMIANIAFSPGIDRAHADLLIRISQTISYRQLCLLSIFGRKGSFKLRQTNFHDSRTQPVKMISLLQEIFQLSYMGLIASESGAMIFGHTDIVPANLKPEGEGDTFYRLMELSKIDQSELSDTLHLLE